MPILVPKLGFFHLSPNFPIQRLCSFEESRAKMKPRLIKNPMALQCHRLLESGQEHGGTLRRDGTKYICQECYDREQGIEVKRSLGREKHCSQCGELIYTRFRNGKINVASVSMKAGKPCCPKCQTIIGGPNPLGKTPSRDELAREALREKFIKAHREIA